MKDADAASVIKLAGAAYPVDTSPTRIRALEAWCGCSVFQLVKAGANSALTVDQMAMIAACIAVPPVGDAMFGRIPMMIEHPMLPPGPLLNPLATAIMEAGLVATLPALLHPLAKAIGLNTVATGG